MSNNRQSRTRRGPAVPALAVWHSEDRGRRAKGDVVPSSTTSHATNDHPADSSHPKYQARVLGLEDLEELRKYFDAEGHNYCLSTLFNPPAVKKRRRPDILLGPGSKKPFAKPGEQERAPIVSPAAALFLLPL